MSTPVVDLVELLGAPETVICPYCANTEEPVPLAFHCYPVSLLRGKVLRDTAVCPSCDQSIPVGFTPARGGTLDLTEPEGTTGE